eukprot:CAMPEP_0113648938 /NCGR_PEP_ID=MMETSP0017_2-20120614/25986_1 /TAXON_ID=2856 /ORGANISM="Cylindrotheca closterium" /LENGTH=85 /DNA_ID=CAMNT_0000561245 /DNA_START=29 /DNA_END=283 /DNA_ORIENTATION=+ /assembly_acc=CAM_ASM_000147
MNISVPFCLNTAPSNMVSEPMFERIQTAYDYELAKPCFNDRPSQTLTPKTTAQPKQDPNASLMKVLSETLSLRFDDDDDDFVIDE